MAGSAIHTGCQPRLGKLPQDETLRLKEPVLSQSYGWVSGQIQRGLCGWRKGHESQGGGGQEGAGILGKREFKLYGRCV